jgi:hypothetical protein
VGEASRPADNDPVPFSNEVLDGVVEVRESAHDLSVPLLDSLTALDIRRIRGVVRDKVDRVCLIKGGEVLFPTSVITSETF